LLGQRCERFGAIKQTFGFETIQVGYGQQVFVTKTDGARSRFVFLHASRSLSHARLLSPVSASPQARREEGGDNRFILIGVTDSVLYSICSVCDLGGFRTE